MAKKQFTPSKEKTAPADNVEKTSVGDISEKTQISQLGETTVPKEKAEQEPLELKKINDAKPESPADSAMKEIEDAVEKGDPVKTDAGFETQFDGTLDKSTAERLANRLNALEKGDEIDLNKVVDIVVSQVEELHREKSRRFQQDRRTIQNLRSKDPKGKKTCGRCGFRVDIAKMDAKKELCEICSS